MGPQRKHSGQIHKLTNRIKNAAGKKNILAGQVHKVAKFINKLTCPINWLENKSTIR